METLIERLEVLKSNGYNLDFRVDDKGCLAYSLPSSKNSGRLNATDAIIDSTHRIESDSDPTHQTVVYAISSKEENLKGVLINSFGPYSESDKNSIIEQIPVNKTSKP